MQEMAVFSPNLGQILNGDVILGQIFGRNGGFDDILRFLGEGSVGLV